MAAIACFCSLQSYEVENPRAVCVVPEMRWQTNLPVPTVVAVVVAEADWLELAELVRVVVPVDVMDDVMDEVIVDVCVVDLDVVPVDVSVAESVDVTVDVSVDV